MRFPLFALPALACAMSASFSRGAVLLQDEFDNDVVTTGASTNLIGAWTVPNGTAVESGGSVTMTAGTGGYAEGNLRSAVSTNLNIFTSAVKMSVTGFSQAGTGGFADYERFRIGLTSRTSTATDLSFYGSDDAVALSISNDGKSYALGYKFNAPNAGDPSSTTNIVNSVGNNSGTLSAAITGFDFTVSSTTWEIILYYGAGLTSTNSGTWTLPQGQSAWGNATDGLGSSALNMYAQNSFSTGTGTSSFTLGSINVTSTAVPEPSRGMLLVGAAIGLCLRRRRLL